MRSLQLFQNSFVFNILVVVVVSPHNIPISLESLKFVCACNIYLVLITLTDGRVTETAYSYTNGTNMFEHCSILSVKAKAMNTLLFTLTTTTNVNCVPIEVNIRNNKHQRATNGETKMPRFYVGKIRATVPFNLRNEWCRERDRERVVSLVLRIFGNEILIKMAWLMHICAAHAAFTQTMRFQHINSRANNVNREWTFNRRSNKDERKRKTWTRKRKSIERNAWLA